MDQSSKSGIISPLLYALTLSLGMFLGFKLHDSIKKQMHSKSNTESNLHDLIKLISDKYVDSLDEKALYKSTPRPHRARQVGVAPWRLRGFA
jgi:hypothetical protein